MSIASHKLRASVSMIHGYAPMLEEDTYGPLPEPTHQPIAQIAESSKTLASVIEDYLNVSRIELCKMEYKFELLDLKSPVKDVIERMKPDALKRGLELSLTTDGSEGYPASVDTGKITQALLSLLDSAIKYTPRGLIAVLLSRNDRGQVIRLVVRDTGNGMDKETLSRLFQKFSRADDAKEANTTGTGLGLYVAVQLVKAHAGRLWAESPGRGKGSVFFVDLPLDNKFEKEKFRELPSHV